jgi:hypothetical protein
VIIDDNVVSLLAEVAGFPLPPDDRVSLRRALSDHLETAAVLAATPSEEFEPIVSFDPRWL